MGQELDGKKTLRPRGRRSIWNLCVGRQPLNKNSLVKYDEPLNWVDRSLNAMEFTCLCCNVESHYYKQWHGVNDICPWCVGLFECALVVLVVATFAPMWGGGVRIPRCTNIKVYDHHGVRTQHSRRTSLLQFQFISLMRDATVLCLRNCGRRVWSI